MSIIPLITIDIVALVTLILSIFLVQRNGTIKQISNRYYVIAACFTMIIISMEIASMFLLQSNDPKWIPIHKIVNVIGFGLSPLVPYFMLLFQNQHYKRKLLTMLPWVVNLLVVISSYFNGLIFQVNQNNEYARGSLFCLSVMFCAFYCVLLFIEVFTSHFKRERLERIFIYLIVSLPIIGTIMQIVFPDVLLIWSFTALSIMFYYRFVRESQLRFDPLTKLLTRSMLDVEMELYNRGNKDLATATVVVLDLNDFKRINDVYGHSVGDEALHKAAQLLSQCFIDIGKCFRMGGDEFVVVCENILEEIMKQNLNRLNEQAKSISVKSKKMLSYSYGYASYNENSHKTFQDIIHDADERMYFNKAKYKANQFLEIIK